MALSLSHELRGKGGQLQSEPMGHGDLTDAVV